MNAPSRGAGKTHQNRVRMTVFMLNIMSLWLSIPYSDHANVSFRSAATESTEATQGCTYRFSVWLV